MSTLSITTNTSALSVQRNLAAANDRSASSLAKLSSGSRVPTARDDAASLAIGSRLEAEIAGLNQASINASQATSMLQIADGALSEINDVLVRMKSLSVQSSSGQLSDTERSLLDSEFQNLKSEIDRITDDTEFNGNPLLNGGDVKATTMEASTGSLDSLGLKISYDTNKVSGVADADGDGTYETAGDVFSVSYDQATTTISLKNETTGEVVNKNIETALDEKAGVGNDLGANQELEVAFSDMGVTVTLDNDFSRTTSFGMSISAKDAADGTTNIPTYTNLSIDDISGAFDSTALDALKTAGAYDETTGMLTLSVQDNAGAVTISGAGLEFSVDGGAFAAGPTADLVSAASQTIEVRLAGGESLFSISADAIASHGDENSTLEIPMKNLFTVQEDVLNTATFDYQVGTGTSASDTIQVTVEGATTTSLGINSSSIDTQETSKNAINEVGHAIDVLQSVRANVGASLSRLEFASSNLSVAIENSESAKSGLLDVDVATETTKYTAEQVIVQAGVSLLAQANQRPQTLLSLLQQ